MAANQGLCGQLWGKVPGRNQLSLYYLELTEKHLHIFEGSEDTTALRKHLRSLEVNSSDFVSLSKKSIKFVYDRGNDGRYSFICNTEEERERWMNNLQKLIHKRDLLEKGIDKRSTFTASLPPQTNGDPPLPPLRAHTLHHHRHSSDSTPPPPPPHKRDSGFVSSGWEVTHTPYHSSGSDDGVIAHRKSNSGGGTVAHATVAVTTGGCHSADGKLVHSTASNRDASREEEEDLMRYQWYWGPMNRSFCEQELRAKGQVGNFVVRKNDSGFFIMSFWRKDAIHHHKILKKGKLYYFEKAAVEAEGEGIPDLLTIYMKHCTDKTIGPYGGDMHPSYDEAWNPPDIDFDKFQKKLSDIKDATGKKRMFAAGPSAEMHTYGGLTLQQMKEVIQVDSEPKQPMPIPGGGLQFPIKPSDLKATGVNNKNKPLPPPPSPKQKTHSSTPPTNRAGRSPAHHKDSSPSQRKRSPEIPPVPESPRHNRPNSYVNLLPPSPSQPKPHVNNGYKPSTSQGIHEEDEYDDDEQEVYVEPGKMENSDPVYQNHNFDQPSKSSYANVNVDCTQDAGIYQNVTQQGTPYTPPRVKPRPKPKK